MVVYCAPMGLWGKGGLAGWLPQAGGWAGWEGPPRNGGQLAHRRGDRDVPFQRVLLTAQASDNPRDYHVPCGEAVCYF